VIPFDPRYIEINHIGVPADELVASLVNERVIRLVPEEDDTPAIGRLFWRAFCAAGRQGVAYLSDSIYGTPIETFASCYLGVPS
jgi:hypothetical protein